MKKIYILIFFSLLAVITGVILISKKAGEKPLPVVGQVIDSLNHVYVYYNGRVGNVCGRNLSPDGYNLGLKYQCVEFVKRYYYEYLEHKMPDSYGNATDFFDAQLNDGEINKNRNLVQYTNPGKVKPQINDIVVFSGTPANKYGHVAIISDVGEEEIEIIQQNPGPRSNSRVKFRLKHENNSWKIEQDRILGWLRKN